MVLDDVDADPQADARARVLAAASRLFYERGIRAVGMDAIRDAAGVPLKRVYALFPGKDALVAAVLAARAERAMAAVRGAAGRDGDTRAGILALFDLVRTWAEEPGYRGCAFLNALGELGTDAEVAGAVRAHKADWSATLDELVAAGPWPPDVAGQLAVLLNGAMATTAVVGSSAPAVAARAAAETLLDVAAVAR